MADTPANPARLPTGQPGMGAPETQVGRGSTIGVDLGIPEGKPGENRSPIEREPDHGLAVTIDGKDAAVQRVDSSAETEPGEVTTEKQPVGEEALAAEEPELPEYDAEKPEAVEAYTKAFTTEAGALNQEALQADWAKNAKVDPKTGEITGALSEGTYKFLESKGLTREMVKSVEAGQVAQMTLQRQEVFNLAGGQGKYLSAVNWGRDGGYTPEQIKEFNAALAAGGAKRKDAIDLLMTRHSTANPARRPASPQRSTGASAVPAGGSQTGAKPFDTYGDYQASLRKARSTNDQALLNETRARLKASPWYEGNKAK